MSAIQWQVFEYRLRSALSETQQDVATYKEKTKDRPRTSFVLGTILHGNKVLVNDTYNPQWNNRQYYEELGIDVYPPYPEASGYAMSAAVAAFLAKVGSDDL